MELGPFSFVFLHRNLGAAYTTSVPHTTSQIRWTILGGKYLKSHMTALNAPQSFWVRPKRSLVSPAHCIG
eukprot:2320362-Rhodomonas_salina.2